ncbi:MAG: histidine phosphatase family protein [Deltaproteobacteria bacterium]|nr:histidine phosphatase family protein [Deltaproteobacteria bacterium]
MIRELCIAASLLLGCARGASPTTVPTSDAAATDAPAPVVLVFVRHAEKTGEDADAELSELGMARARCLADTLEPLAVTHVLATDKRRTQQTVAPLAERRGLAITTVPAGDHDGWVARLRGLPPASVAVVAGHSNTVPELIAALGGAAAPIDHAVYDRLLVLTLPAHGRATAATVRYCIAAGA